MAKILERMKSVLKRNRGPQLPPGSYPNPVGNPETLGTITKPAYQTDDDDEEEDIESLKNYNVPEQTRLRGQPINTTQSDDITPNRNTYGTPSTPRSELLNSSNTQLRGSSSGFVPDLPMNNTNISTAPELPSRPGFPFLSQPQGPSSRPVLNPTPTNNPQPSFAGFPPGMNLNQPTPLPPPPNNPQQPFDGFTPGMNQNQSASTNNPKPSFAGFPPGMNQNQSASTNNPQPSFAGFPPGMNQNQSASTNNPQSSFAGFPPGMNQNQSHSTNNPQPSFAGFPPGMNQNQSASTNNPQPSFAGFPPGMNQNQSHSTNNPQPSFAGFPPGMNQNQSASTNNPQPSFAGFPPGMNFNQTQSPANNNSHSPLNQASAPSTVPNPQSSFPGFPPGMNTKSLFPPSNVQTNDSNNVVNPQQGTLSKRSPSFRNQLNNHDDNVSRLELDYPIENVLIDANIPSAVAIKINDVVEQDRLGNAYHIHRYTFEPSQPQQISYGNNQSYVENTFQGGTRHIREIRNDDQNPLFNDISYSSRSNKHSRRRHHHYSETELDQYIDQLLHTPGSTVIQAQNYNDLQQILNQQLLSPQILPPQPSINSFQSNTNALTEPVFYYTARALYNDPMRNY